MRWLVGIIALAAGVVGATQLSYAASAPVKAPVHKVQFSPAYNWSGFYLGGNVGYGWSTLDAAGYYTDGTPAGTSSQDRDGVFGGGQIGYNFMINPSFLLGIEGDFDWANLTGTTDSCSINGCAHSDGKTTWFTTIRGRIGYVMNNWMIFATGGGAWTHGGSTRTVTPFNVQILPGTASVSGTNGGWTIGGGVEYGFAQHWSAALEYLYIETSGDSSFIYANSNFDRNSHHTTYLDTVRLDINYHFN